MERIIDSEKIEIDHFSISDVLDLTVSPTGQTKLVQQALSTVRLSKGWFAGDEPLPVGGQFVVQVYARPSQYRTV